MVVKQEICSVREQHLPDRRFKDHTIIDEVDTELLRRLIYHSAVLEEDPCRRKSVRLKDKFAFEILDLIKWTAIAILTLFEVRDPSGARSTY
jgi:hypothetical protein